MALKSHERLFNQTQRYAIAGASREIGLQQTMLSSALQREDADSVHHHAQTILQAVQFILEESSEFRA